MWKEEFAKAKFIRLDNFKEINGFNPDKDLPIDSVVTEKLNRELAKEYQQQKQRNFNAWLQAAKIYCG